MVTIILYSALVPVFYGAVYVTVISTFHPFVRLSVKFLRVLLKNARPKDIVKRFP